MEGARRAPSYGTSESSMALTTHDPMPSSVLRGRRRLHCPRLKSSRAARTFLEGVGRFGRRAPSGATLESAAAQA